MALSTEIRPESGWYGYVGATLEIPYFITGDIQAILSVTAPVYPVNDTTEKSLIPLPEGGVEAAAVPMNDSLGWIITLTDTQTGALAPGLYVTQLVFELVAGGKFTSDLLYFRILQGLVED